MRKIKFLTAMALLVFIFSGCGGSADSSSEEESDTTTYHEKISTLITGEWEFKSTSTYNGTAWTAANATLGNFENFKMSFSDIEFGSDSQTASGKAKVYYSFTCTAGTSKEKTKITSYESSASSIYKEMTLTRVSDKEWNFQDSNSSINLKFADNGTTDTVEVIMTGKGNFEGLGSDCYYRITCTFSKVSASPIDDTSGSDDTDGKTIKSILEGTWLFSTGSSSGATESATATSDTAGTTTTLTLKLASDVTLKFADIDLEPDDNTTSLTGTVTVDYAQKWTAYNSSSVKQGADGAFAFSKSNATMKIIKVDDGIWRIEDTTNSNENIIITINSSTEIQTVWTGSTTANLGGNIDSYTYNITCVFRKQ